LFTVFAAFVPRRFFRWVARVRFLTDEHTPKAVANGLRARGADAATVAETGQLGAADGARHAGILFAPASAAIGLLIGGAMLLVEVLTAEEMLDHVELL